MYVVLKLVRFLQSCVMKVNLVLDYFLVLYLGCCGLALVVQYFLVYMINLGYFLAISYRLLRIGYFLAIIHGNMQYIFDMCSSTGRKI